jgi:hypothetical protein
VAKRVVNIDDDNNDDDDNDDDNDDEQDKDDDIDYSGKECDVNESDDEELNESDDEEISRERDKGNVSSLAGTTAEQPESSLYTRITSLGL